MLPASLALLISDALAVMQFRYAAQKLLTVNYFYIFTAFAPRSNKKLRDSFSSSLAPSR